MDDRIKKLAKNIVGYSIAIKPKEKVLIDAKDSDCKIVNALIDEIYRAGGYPYVQMTSSEVQKSLLKNVSNESLQPEVNVKLEQMKQMDAWIGIRGVYNLFEMSDIPKDKMQLYNKLTEPIKKSV